MVHTISYDRNILSINTYKEVTTMKTKQKKIPVDKPLTLSEAEEYVQREQVRFVMKQLMTDWNTRTAVFQERHFSLSFDSDGAIHLYQQDNEFQSRFDGKELATIHLDRKDPDQYTINLSTPKRIFFRSPIGKTEDKDKVDFTGTPKEIQQWEKDSKDLAIVRKANTIVNTKSKDKYIHVC